MILTLDVLTGASMGPPELPGGNLAADEAGDAVIISLQWGRRNYPAETLTASWVLSTGLLSFNGAAGITRRKQVAFRCSSGCGPLLQWGRRNYPAETGELNIGTLRSRRRFNGAAGITRRKR